MAFFDSYPVTQYELNGKTYYITDIFRKAAFITEYRNVADMYSMHFIADGETPETVSEEYYDTSEYYWVILLFNEIHDMVFDWPQDQYTVELLAQQKYGDALYQTKHYVKNGIVVGEFKEFSSPWVVPDNPGPGDPTIYPVSFMEYEYNKNDKKREIRILRPELLSEFVRQFEEAISG